MARAYTDEHKGPSAHRWEDTEEETADTVQEDRGGVAGTRPWGTQGPGGRMLAVGALDWRCRWAEEGA